MANTVIPTLSDEGWVSNNKIKLSRAYLYFLISDYSQTDTYKDEVSSLKYIVYTHTGTGNELDEELIRVLKKYMGRFFTEVDVFINKRTEGNIFNVEIEIIVKDEHKNPTSLTSVLEIKNSEVTNIDDIINKLG
jgi:hypothetical protein